MFRTRKLAGQGLDAPELPMGGSRGEAIGAVVGLVILLLIGIGFWWQATH